MDAKKVTSWCSWKEWKAVVDDVYSNDIEVNRRALSRINVWESRDSNVSSVIMCLKELLLAKISQVDKKTASPDQLQMYQTALAMNIVRFINFITEPHQKSLQAQPIKKIAMEIGLPDWIVNLRHNATHFNLPSLEMLEEAREFLLRWMKTNYVDTYKEFSLDNYILENIKDEIKNSLKEYMNSRYKLVSSKGKKKSLAKKKHAADLDENVKIFIKTFRNETFNVLLESGYMIPNHEQLSGIGIIAEEYVEEESLDLPEAFLNIWRTVLDYCNQLDYIEYFFERLIQTYKNETDATINIRNKFLLTWILHFLRMSSTKDDKYRLEFSIKDLLLSLLRSKPSNLSMMLLKEVSQIPSFRKEINPDVFEKMQAILGILCTPSQPKKLNQRKPFPKIEVSTESNGSIYDHKPFYIENDDEEFRQQTKRLKKDESIWQLLDDDTWNDGNYKLGLTESQTIDTLELELPKFESNEVNSVDVEHKKETIVDETQDTNKLKKLVFNNYWTTNV